MLEVWKLGVDAPVVRQRVADDAAAVGVDRQQPGEGEAAEHQDDEDDRRETGDQTPGDGPLLM
jgi:hypothetical protein